MLNLKGVKWSVKEIVEKKLGILTSNFTHSKGRIIVNSDIMLLFH